jgi:Coenzyme PQQ synthesis protein D (PqqD)
VLPKRRSDVLSRTVDDELVILDRQTGHVHRLNSTASCIWSYCDGQNTPADIAAHVAKDFSRSADLILCDVLDAVEKLRRLGLLSDDSATP